MNIRKVLFVTSVLLAAVACGSSSSQGEAPEQESEGEEDLTAKALLQGSWIIVGGEAQGFNLRPNGEYFIDRHTVREEGRFTANKAKRTLTFTGNLGKRVYSYLFIPSPSNADPLRPAARLTLALRSTDGVPASEPVSQTFARSKSWCTSVADCDKEESDFTWTPAKPHHVRLANKCVTATNKCDFSIVTDRERVVAKCSPPGILNGVVDPRTQRRVDIIDVNPGGLTAPHFEVDVKLGDSHEILTSCTGELSSWTLKCTTSSGVVGSFSSFTLTDKNTKAAKYHSQVVSPTASGIDIDYNCSLSIE